MFKGELTLEYIMWHLPKTRLYELRDARKKALIEEQKELDAMRKEQDRANIRQTILSQ